MPGGNCRSVLEIAACTSWAAASMSRDRVNVSVMFVLPRVLDDVMASMPAIVENCFSSGVATAAAIVCGLAPGRPAPTVIVGKSTFGRSLTGSSRYAISPNMRIPNITSVVATGRRINSPEKLISGSPPTRGLRSRTAADVDLGVRRETQLTIDHHQGAGRHARHDGETVQRAFHRHRLRRGGAVVVDDEHVCALLTLHDRLTGHDDGIILNAQNECDGDVLARPERAVAIGKAGLQQHGGRGRWDLGGDKGKDAGARRP